MRLLLIGLAALAASPAAANEHALHETYYTVPSAPHHGRAYVYLGYDDRWGSRVFSRDDGYFQGRGGGVATANGRAVYDYDRDYPFDFPRGWGADEPGFIDDTAVREPECRIELVPDRRLGSAEVRICS